MAWRNIQNPLYPWVTTLDRILKSVDPSSMQGPTMVIASDSGGTDKRSRYRVNVYLCVDLEASPEWEISRREVRRSYLADGRRMSYKGLSDRQRAKALIPFLSAAERIHGLCVVTVFNRMLRHLCLNPGDYVKMRNVAGLQALWKDQELEEALRMTQLVACLVGGLSQPGQNFYWISDQDNLLGNSKQSHDVGRLLSSFSSHYTHHALGDLGIGTTALDEGDRWEEDLTAVADLVAGGVAETANRLSEVCGGRIPTKLAVEYSKEFVPKADLIARWLWTGGGPLRRVAILFERELDRQYSVSKFEMVTE